MNQFQILDKNNNPITIELLDKEACKLWEKTSDKKWYAFPNKDDRDIGNNWFDRIGWLISEGFETWESIKNELINPYLKVDGETIESLKTYYPLWGHIELVEQWEKSGYTPKMIK